MFILSNGCSHTFFNFDNSYPSIVAKNLLKDESVLNQTTTVTKELFGGKLIEKVHKENKIDYTQKNLNVTLSWPSKSNDFIFHETIEYILYLKNRGIKPDLVFIQWTGPNRRMHLNQNNEWVSVGPYFQPNLQIKLEPMASQHTLHYMILLQNFFKKEKIKYRFINYVSLDSSLKNLKSFNELNLKKFITIENLHPIFDSLKDYFVNKKWITDSHGHPNIDAHNKLAEIILKEIKPNYKLKNSNFKTII